MDDATKLHHVLDILKSIDFRMSDHIEHAPISNETSPYVLKLRQIQVGISMAQQSAESCVRYTMAKLQTWLSHTADIVDAGFDPPTNATIWKAINNMDAIVELIGEDVHPVCGPNGEVSIESPNGIVRFWDDAEAELLRVDGGNIVERVPFAMVVPET